MSSDRDGVHRRKGRPGFILSYTDAHGNRRLKTVHCKTLTEAKALRAALLTKVEKQKILGTVEAADDTFEKVAQRYLAYQKPRVSEQTYERLSGIIERHLNPAFKMKIGAITRARVSDFVTDRLSAASPATVEKEFNCLKHILRLAHEEWAIIPTNPAKALTIKSLRIKLPAGRVRYLHPDELLALLEHSPVWLHSIIILGVGTGMRRGNILNLRWTEYDERRRILNIQHTKNNERLVVHLNEIAIMGLVMAERHFGRSQIGRVFPDVTEDQVSMAFRRAREKAKIPDVRFHDLRHSFASWLRMSGADIHSVSQLLGHRDLRMTARYSHLSSDYLAGTSNLLNSTFSSLLQLNPAPDSAVNGDRCPIAASIENDDEKIG